MWEGGPGLIEHTIGHPFRKILAVRKRRDELSHYLSDRAGGPGLNRATTPGGGWPRSPSSHNTGWRVAQVSIEPRHRVPHLRHGFIVTKVGLFATDGARNPSKLPSWKQGMAR